MSIPITGWFILGVVFFCSLYRMSLLKLLIFSLPFSAVSVLDFTSVDNSINAPNFISLLYVLSRLRDVRFYFRYLSSVSFIFFVITLSIMVLSFVLSFICSGYINSKNIYLAHGGFTQVLFVVLGGGVSFFIASELASQKINIDEVVKCLLFSVITISALGFYQAIAYYTDIYYPYEILNNNLNQNAKGYSGLEIGLKRISASSTEPSIFAQFLLVSLVFLSHLRYRKKFWGWSIIFIIVLVTLMSTSATAVIGILVITIYMLWRFFRTNPIYCGLVILCAMVVLFLWGEEGEYLLMHKFESYSFNERFGSVINGLEVFLQNPVIGGGWGQITVHSMPVGLLANGGLLLFLVFTFWFSYELRFSFNVGGLKNNVFSRQCKSIYYGFIFMLVLQFITGFLYVYSFFWFFLGMVIGVNRLIYMYSRR